MPMIISGEHLGYCLNIKNAEFADKQKSLIKVTIINEGFAPLYDGVYVIAEILTMILLIYLQNVTAVV